MANSLIFNYIDSAKKDTLDKALAYIDAIKDAKIIAYDDTNIRRDLRDVSIFAHGIHIPSFVGELSNDAGYLVNDDISSFVTASELESKGYLTEHQSLEGYALNSDINIHLNNLDASVEAALEIVREDVSTALAGARRDIDTAVLNVEQYTDDKVLALNNELTSIINANRSAAANDLEYAVTRAKGDLDASIVELDTTKQDKFIVGTGLALENGILSSTIDTTLFRIVDELPSTNIENNKIYLISTHNSTTGDIYTEHIHTNDGWEKLGEFKATTDLSGYYNKDQVDNIVLTSRQSLESSISTIQSNNNLAHIEINGQISALQTEDTRLQSYIDERTGANDTSIQNLQNTVADHKVITDANSASIVALDASLVAIFNKEASDFASLSFLISNEEDNINGLRQSISALDTSINPRLDSIDIALGTKASSLEVESLSSTVSGLSTTIESKAEIEDVSIALSGKADLEAIQGLQESIAAQDASIVSSFSAQDASISEISETIAVQDTSISGIIETISAQDASIVSIEESITVQDASISGIIETVSAQDTSIVSIEESIAAQDASIASIIQDNENQDASISEIVETIENLWNVEEESDSFDYIYDEDSWNASFTNGVLNKYYTKYPDEDLFNTTTGAAATFNDKQYEVGIYSDADAQTLVSSASFKAGWVSVTVQRITNVADNTEVYFIPKDATKDGNIYELFSDSAMTTSANKYIKITGISYPGFSQSWNGAVSAPGAKFPWICPNFDEDVNASIKFRYEGLDDVLPWSYKIFGNGTGHKEWAIASVPAEFENNSFLIPANQENGKPEWDGTAGDNSFDITKFKMILVKPAGPESTKAYISSMLCNYVAKSDFTDLLSRVEALEASESTEIP